MTRLTALYAFLESSFFAPSQVLDQLSAAELPTIPMIPKRRTMIPLSLLPATLSSKRVHGTVSAMVSVYDKKFLRFSWVFLPCCSVHLLNMSIPRAAMTR